MSKLRLTLEIIFVLLIVVLTAAFALANEIIVALDLLVTSVEINVGMSLVLALAVGTIIGYLLRLPAHVTLKARLAQSERKYKKVAAERASV